tara:strand:- start:8109 stop:8981 length:873 start_codon:yes stop_codon:yes gene_type:complete
MIGKQYIKQIAKLSTLCFIMLFAMAAQAAPKKAKVRMSVQYVKVMNNESYIVVKTKAKTEDGYQPVDHLKLKVYQVFGDSNALLGEIETIEDGSAKFNLASLVSLDSLNTFNYLITNDASDLYKKGDKKLSFQDVSVEAGVVTKDSVNYIQARATNALTGAPISEAPIRVQVKRLFSPLIIGQSNYKTDDNGSIFVELPNDIPGMEGVLEMQVLINESDDYGTVINEFEAPIGVPVVTTDTFDQRTMWSPPSKTPIYLLVFPNLIILGIWGTLLMLVINLVRIYKSKNKN